MVNQKSNKCILPDHEMPLYKRLKQQTKSWSGYETFDEPQGLIWDGENYGCVYDALFSILGICGQQMMENGLNDFQTHQLY